MASIIINIILVVILILILYYVIPFIIKRRRLCYYIEKMPGPPSLPILGNTLEFITTPQKLWNIMRYRNDLYYPIHRVWFAKYPIINVRHPDDAEVLLTSQKNIQKSMLYDLLKPWFGTGLLTSTGPKWQHRRKILTPAFHFNILRGFTTIFDKEGRRMVKDLKSKQDDVTVDLIAFIPKYTLNAICETAMGTSLANTENGNDKFLGSYRKAVHALGKILLERTQKPWLQVDSIFQLTSLGKNQDKYLNIVRGFSKNIIEERKRYHDEMKGVINLNELNVDSDFTDGSKKKLAMLDLLIAQMKNEQIDDAGIWEEVDTFMFEGHDTTGMGICFTLLLLAEHREIQQKVREEVDEILKKTSGHFTITELQQLNYLDRCIKEALRIYPSVPFISRNIVEDMQLKDYFIPKGTIAHLHIYDVHRDPNFWPDPLRYDPDRFLPENIIDRHPFSYIPFSGGPRNCIGQKFGMLELKAMIGHLLHNFYLEPVDLAGEVQMLPDLVLRPEHGARIKFVPRQ